MKLLLLGLSRGVEMQSSLLVVAAIVVFGFCQRAIGTDGPEPALPRIIRTINLSQLDFTDAARFDRAAFGKDGRILVATSKGEIWDIGLEKLDGRKLAQSERPTNFDVASEPSARLVLFYSYSGEFVCISTESGEVRWAEKLQTPNAAVAISPDGNLFATARDTTAIVRKLNDRSVVGTHVSDRIIEDVAFSADSKLLAVTKHDGADIVLAHQPDKLVTTISGRSIPRVLSFVGKGDGERLCLESYDGPNNGHLVTFYDTRNWNGDSLTLDKDNGNPIGMTKSPGGEWLMISTNATHHYDRIRSGLWFLNVTERKLHAPDSEPRSMLSSVDFSRDGNLALDQCDRTIRIWRMPLKSSR